MAGSTRPVWPAVAVAGGLALALPAGLLVALSAVGVPLLPQNGPAAASASASEDRADLAVLADSPATRSVAAILGAGPDQTWSALGDATWAVGTPYDYACALAQWKGPRAAVSAQRAFSHVVATGTPATAATAITVAVHAYGAGAGAPAFEALRERIDQCPQRESSVSAETATVAGTEALVGQVRPDGAPAAVESVAWRRGDVVLDVHSAGLSRSELLAVAETVDRSAVGILTPVCADLASTAEDAGRSPWVDREHFTGLRRPQLVTASPLPMPPVPSGAPSRDLASPLEPLPSITAPTATPSEPLWPPVPSPVPTPSAPSPVGPQPSSTTYLAQQRDPEGPGCGWAFTGQQAPPYDADAASAARATALEAARQALATAQSDWTLRVQEYWSAAALYQAGLAKYRLYAAKVGQATKAWAVLQLARDTYAQALLGWQKAVADRTALITAQQQAARDYQAALDVCATFVPAPPTPSASLTGSPAPSPTLPEPTPSTTPTCPPVRPTLLDQTVPPMPPTPSPPPDPRPSASASPSQSR